jgi:hypothetical protein
MRSRGLPRLPSVGVTAVREGLRRLRASIDDGRLAALCADHDVSLLVVFGSALDPVAEPRDLDAAVRFGDYAPEKVLPLVDALAELAGTAALDVMILNTAGPVAREQALIFGQPLFEARPNAHAEAQIAATMERLDTAHLRRLQLDLLQEDQG